MKSSNVRKIVLGILWNWFKNTYSSLLTLRRNPSLKFALNGEQEDKSYYLNIYNNSLSSIFIHMHEFPNPRNIFDQIIQTVLEEGEPKIGRR